MITVSIVNKFIDYNDSETDYGDSEVSYSGLEDPEPIILDWQTLIKTEGLTKEPDTLSFEILEKTGRTIPELQDEIEMEINSVLIFGGVVTEISEIIVGGLLVGHQIQCKDYSHLFDRELVIKSYENQTLRDIILDIVATFTTGFTTNNIPAVTPTITSIKFNYEPPTKAIQKLVDLVGLDWYIDYEKDLNVIDENTNTAPFEITDTNDKINWESLKTEKNILDLRNAIIIRGGEFKSTISEGDAVDKQEADGVRRTFNLALRYSGINVKKNAATQTVGVDNITDPTTVDVLYNFQEKTLKWPEASKPSSGDTITVWGDAFIPLIAKIRDQVSIATYGEYQDIKIDKTIISVNEAQTLGKAILKDWANGAYELTFTTRTDGLRTGQYITINSSIRGINKVFKITKITARARSSEALEYDIFCLASGETTFVDMMVGLLGKDRINVDINDDEVLQRLETFLESINSAEVLSASSKSPPYTWGSGGANDFQWDLFTWS